MIGVVLMADPATVLERALVPADLRQDGASLYRRLSRVLGHGARIGNDSFVRPSGIPTSVVVQLRKEASSADALYLLVVNGSRVQAIQVPAKTGWGVYAGEWRRRNRRIVGTFYDEIGNRTAVGVVIFRDRPEGWRLAGMRETENEASGVAFAGSGLDRFVISTPNDDFRAFVEPPHAGPHLTTDTIWQIRNSQIQIGTSHKRHNALYTFDRFVDAVQRGDRSQARMFCHPKAFTAAWKAVRRMQSAALHAVGTDHDANDSGHIFGFFDHRSLFDRRMPSEPRIDFVFAHGRHGWQIDHLRFPPPPSAKPSAQ